MLESQVYQVVANAFTVGDVADAIVVRASSNETAAAFWEGFYERAVEEGSDYASEFILVQEDGVVGYLTFEDDHADQRSKALGEIAHPVSSSQMVPVSTPLLDMFPLFEKHHFFFVLSKNEITHVITFSHLDTLPVKLCIFSLVIELETEMLRRLTASHSKAERYLGYLTEARLRKARELCQQKYKKGTESPERLLLCTNFLDKFNIFLSDSELLECLPLKGKHGASRFFNKVQDMRNQIAHSDSILAVIREPSMMNAFVSDLRAVISSVALHVPDTRNSSHSKTPREAL